MGSRADRRTWVQLSWLVAAPLLAGCEPSVDTPRGGQSGTEGGGSTVCEPTKPRDVSPEQVLPYFESSLNELSASLAVPAVPGLWLSTGTRAELSVTIPPDTRARQISNVGGGGICSSVLELEALAVRSSDGAVDAQVRARFVLAKSSPGDLILLEATLPALPDGYVGPAVWPPDDVAARQWLSRDELDLVPEFQPSGSPLLRVLIRPSTYPLDATAVISDGDEILGMWTMSPDVLPSGPPSQYTPHQRFTGECAQARPFRRQEPLEYTPFSSVAAALEGVAGTWVRCLDTAVSSHAGLRILPDGSWQDFTLEGAEPVARFGFEHEGFLHFYDSGATPGLYQIDLLPFGRHYDSQATNWGDAITWASEDALVFNSWNEGWPNAVYLRTSAPVRTAAPEYADGERAGVAACERGERGIATTLEESAALLTGDFVLCSGALRGGVARLHFEESSVTLLREDGSLIGVQPYERETMNAPRLSLLVHGDDGGFRFWVVVVSRSPRKLWIQESDDPASSVAVFSALP